MKRTAATAVCAVLAAGSVVIFAGPALAAWSLQPITCDGISMVLRTNDNNSSDNGGWSVAHVVSGGSGHLIPTSFSFSGTDTTRSKTFGPFTQYKGGGHANQNQQTVTCTQSMSGTLADMLAPGDTPPPGWAFTDEVTMTLTVTAIPKP